MGTLFQPGRTAPSAYTIDYPKEYERGIRALVFDIDNTLVPQDAPADDRAADFLSGLQKQGFLICLISNNDLLRVKTFADAVRVPFYVEKAKKPGKKGFLKALKILHSGPEDTLCIGDQIFTDIWGANRAGLQNILVGPLDEASDTPLIRVKRKLERLLFKQYPAL